MQDINPVPIDTDLAEPIIEITPDPEAPENEDLIRVKKTQEKIVTIFSKTIGELKSEISGYEDIKSSKQRQVDALNSEIADLQNNIDDVQAELDSYLLQAKSTSIKP